MKKLFLLLLCLSIIGCQSANTLMIDNKIYEKYPAAFVSLDKGKIYPIEDPRIKTVKVDADLWIEPEDPEIRAIINIKNKIVHEGEDVTVASTDLSYKNIKAIKDINGVKWSESIERDKIHEGAVFIVKSSTNKIYKVKIDKLFADRDNYFAKPENRSYMQITFQRIR